MDYKSAAEQIHYLFENKGYFATIAATVDVKKYITQKFDFYNYPLALDWLGIKKNQTACLQEAFSTLFIIDLYFQNDWIDEERNLISIEEIPTAEWQSLIQEKWITDYFQLKYRSPNIKYMDTDKFLKKFLYWMPENAEKTESNYLKEILHSVKWVSSLFPDAYYDKFFGETEDYYFFAESGVYD